MREMRERRERRDRRRRGDTREREKRHEYRHTMNITTCQNREHRGEIVRKTNLFHYDEKRRTTWHCSVSDDTAHTHIP